MANTLLAALYRAFGKYGKTSVIVNQLRNELGEKQASKLQSEPLSGLTADDLAEYAWHALNGCGAADCFKHFLPRLFELFIEPCASSAAIGIAATVDTEVLLGKLRDARWREWKSKEKTAVKRYLHDLFFRAIEAPVEDYLYGYFPGAVLCGMGRAGVDLTEFLETWLERDGRPGWHLAAFVSDNAQSLRRNGRLDNAFWDRRSAIAVDQVIEWIRQPVLRQRLEWLKSGLPEALRQAPVELDTYLRSSNPDNPPASAC